MVGMMTTAAARGRIDRGERETASFFEGTEGGSEGGRICRDFAYLTRNED